MTSSRIDKLRDKQARLERELLRQWQANHAEHCGEWPHPEGDVCMWPPPDLLTESGLLRNGQDAPDLSEDQVDVCLAIPQGDLPRFGIEMAESFLFSRTVAYSDHSGGSDVSKR